MMRQWSPVCSSQGAVAKSYRGYVERPQRGEGRTGDHPKGAPTNAHLLCCRLSTYPRYAFEGDAAHLDVCERADTSLQVCSTTRDMAAQRISWIGTAVAAVVLGGACSSFETSGFGADQASEAQPRQVPHIHHTTWKKLQDVQKLIVSKRYGEGRTELESLLSRSDRYNRNEVAQMHRMLAYVYWQLDQPTKSIEQHEKVLEQAPFVSVATESMTQRTLAALHVDAAQPHSGERRTQSYRRALSAMNSYMALDEVPDPGAYYLLAQIHYQLTDYEAGVDSVETAIRIAGERDIPVKEAWTRLLDYMRSSIDAGAA